MSKQEDTIAAQAVEGAQLHIAMKTEAGKQILDAIVDRTAERIDLLFSSNVKTPDDILRVYYEIKGGLELVSELGDSIRIAMAAIARRQVNQRLNRSQEG